MPWHVHTKPNNMKALILMFSLFLLLLPQQIRIGKLPDLSQKKDLADLGKGKIFETDGSSIKDIFLVEINTNSIVYEKKESLHDLYIGSIDRIEFLNSKWGRVQIVFNNFRPVVSMIQ
jgi:hypothetical protein